MARCTNCGSDIEWTSKKCPICQEPNPTRHDIVDNPVALLLFFFVTLIFVFLAFLAPGFVYNYYRPSNKDGIRGIANFDRQSFLVTLAWWVINLLITGLIQAGLQSEDKQTFWMIAFMLYTTYVIKVYAPKIEDFFKSKNIS